VKAAKMARLAGRGKPVTFYAHKGYGFMACGHIFCFNLEGRRYRPKLCGLIERREDEI